MLIEKVKSVLGEKFPDAIININDYKHDGVHIVLEIASEKFNGLSLVQQHRLVYDALKEYIATGELHALKLKTKNKNNVE